MLIKTILEATLPRVPNYSKFLKHKQILHIATAQKIGDDILCVNFYSLKGRSLLLRFFTDGKGFILRREAVTDGTSPWVRHGLERYLGYSAYGTVAEEADNQLAMDFLLKFMDRHYYFRENGLCLLLSAYISQIFQEKRSKANQSKADKLQAAMKLFGDYPQELEAYLHNNLFMGYLFYEKLNKGKRKAFCSHCGMDFQIEKTVKHKSITLCPMCKNRVKFYDKRYVNGINDNEILCIADKSPDGYLLLRWLKVQRTFIDTVETFVMEEFFRMVYQIEAGTACIHSYECKYCYPWGAYWREKSYRCSEMAHVYTANLEAVFGKIFYNIPLKETLEQWKQPLDFVGLLDNLKNLKPTEYLAKLGLTRLASQLHLVDLGKGQDFQSILGVSRQYLPLYRKNNPTLQEHQLIKSAKTWVSEESLEKLRQLNFNAGQVPAMCDLLDTMRFEKFVNYFTKQQGSHRNPLGQIMTWYRDYIQMAQSLEIDLSHKSVRFPSKIKEAHDRLLPQFKEVQTEIEDENFRQAKENLYQNLKEFVKDGFAIVFPQSKSDFIREGNSLSHCVGNMQSYFTNHMSGEKMIFFLRQADKLDTPFVTMEIDMRRLVILQLYGYGDKAPNPEVRKFANEFLKQLSKKEKAERRTEQWQEYTALRAGA